MRSVLARVLLAPALLVLACATAQAQGGDITGTVTDEGHAVPDTKVSVERATDGNVEKEATAGVEKEATKEQAATNTDPNGKFAIQHLSPGKYSVDVPNAEYDQKVEVSEGQKSDITVQLVTTKSVIIPYFVNMLCGALVLILLHWWLRSRGITNDWSVFWLYLCLLSWAVPKIPVLMGWSFPSVHLPQWFGLRRPSPVTVMEPNQVKYLFSIVSNICFAWAAFQLSRVRDLFSSDEQLKRYRSVVVWWIVLPISLVSLTLQLLPLFELTQKHEMAANVIDAVASNVASLVLLIGLTYSFYRYNNRFFIVYTWVTILPFMGRQFYIAIMHSPRAGILFPLSLANTTMLVMLFIALAVAWALSDTARLKLVKISPKVYIVAMFFDLRGSTKWAEDVMEGDFDGIRDFIDALREWVVDEASKLPQVCPTFVKFLGDGYMCIWEIQKDSLVERANAVVELACDLSTDYPSWVKGIKSVLPWEPPDGIGFGVDVRNAIRLTFENGSDDYLGSPVSLASKMQNMARPRGVVIQERTWRDILSEKLADRFPNPGVMRIGDQEIHIRATKEVKLCDD